MVPLTLRLLPLIAGLMLGSGVKAGEVDVVKVRAVKTENSFRFEVTLRHDDTGWDHYADKWEIVAPDGTVLGSRILRHPHVDEQPFTRALYGVEIPQGISQVTVRGHDKVDGYGGDEIKVAVPR